MAPAPVLATKLFVAHLHQARRDHPRRRAAPRPRAGPALSTTPPGTPAGYPEFPYPETGYDEEFRGQFHFSSRSGWLNDPNGSFWYRGQYHLFYQHNPHGPAWDTMHWGHATSPDLVHWTQKPIALEPGVHSGDLWSGNGVVDTGNVTGLRSGPDDPILVFSGSGGATIHYSLDGARTFQSYAGGRKVAVPPGASRDPKVFWHAGTDRWVMVMWSDGGGNGADFYTSADLLSWTWRSRYAASWFFECPDLVPLPVDGDPGNRQWVLTSASGEYVAGDFDGATFRPRTPVRRMDHGANHPDGTFYAGQTFTGDPRGRVIQMAWQPAARGSVWSGSLTFPAELRLRTFPGGVRVTRTPIDELASLRSGTVTVTDRTVTPAAPVSPGSADTYDITAVFDVATATATRFGLRLHTRPDGGHDRAVTYDRADRTLDGAPLSPMDGRVSIRALVDRGQLEVFGNDGALSVSDVVRFDPAAGRRGVQVYAEGGSVRLVRLRLDRLGSAWGTGESTLTGNLAGPWVAAGGVWTDVTGGKLGTATGDGSYLSPVVAGDGTYEADVRLCDAAAAGLTFREHYTATVDAAGLVKLGRPGRDIAACPAPISRGRTYHLKVVAAGPRLRVHLDHGTTPVIDAEDGTHPAGRAGANVFAGTAVIGTITRDAPGFATDLAGPWRPAGGVWTAPGDGVHGRGAGDAFYLSGTTGADFTYEADVRPVNGVAAGLVFRASADAARHYTADVDTSGVVRLRRPGRDIATAAATIVPGRWHHLTVIAAGSRLRVRLDGVPVIDASDSSYSRGLFGLTVFAGTAAFQNVGIR